MRRREVFCRLIGMIILLFMGVGSAWGESVVVSKLTFTSKCNGSGTADDGAVWDIASDASESTFDTGKGIHYGSSSKDVKYVTLTSSAFEDKTIEKVVVNASVAAGSNQTNVSVTVGTTSLSCSGSTVATATATDFEFTGRAKGTIVVRVARISKQQKAIYVKSVQVTYSENAGATTCTVTFDAGTGVCEVTNFTEISEGTGVTLPAATPNDACAAAGWSFVGWATSSVVETTSAPTLYMPGSMYNPEDNVTLYGVYACAENAGVSWHRVKDVATLLAGGTFIMGYEATANSGILVPLRSDGANATMSANGYFYTGTATGASGNSTIDMSSVSETGCYELYITNPTSGKINIQMQDSSGKYYGAPPNSSSVGNSGRLYESRASIETDLTPTLGANDAFALSCAVDTYKYLKYNTDSPRYAFYGSSAYTCVFYKKDSGVTVVYNTYPSVGLASKPIPTMAFEASTYIVKKNETLPAPVYVSESNGVLSYASADEGVAMVESSTGEVTGVAVGETIITVTQAETDEYAQGTASYVLRVWPQTVSVRVGTTGWATYAPPYPIGLPMVEGEDAPNIYYIGSLSDNHTWVSARSFREVLGADEAIAAGTGMLINVPNVQAGVDVEFPVCTDAKHVKGAEELGNLLVGVMENTNMDGCSNAYIFTQREGRLGFYICTGGTLTANKCYLQLKTR